MLKLMLSSENPKKMGSRCTENGNSTVRMKRGSVGAFLIEYGRNLCAKL